MVNVLILTGFGINSDYESQNAFIQAGAENVKRVHLNDLIHKKDSLENYQILMFPGGFADGDYIASGKIMANKFRYHLRKDLEKFIADEKLILGICNGFQIITKMGILPAFDKEYFKQTVTLVQNESKQFESRWVRLKPLKNNCVFTHNYTDYLELPCRHGEGKFVPANEQILNRLIEQNLIPFVYDPNTYPNCPNGAIHGIAGICDETGHIYGMMPHPECHIFDYHHPRWTRGEKPKENGLKLFKNAVEYVRKKL